MIWSCSRSSSTSWVRRVHAQYRSSSAAGAPTLMSPCMRMRLVPSHLAMGCVFGDQWAQGMWRDTDLFTPDFKPNIAVLELLAIVMAPRVTATSLVLKSDNQATVCWINSRRSDIPVAMNLIHHLTKRYLLFQIYVTAEYLPSKVNRTADLVSHNRMTEFFQENPWMRQQPEPLPTTLWPPRWSREQLPPRNCRR